MLWGRRQRELDYYFSSTKTTANVEHSAFKPLRRLDYVAIASASVTEGHGFESPPGWEDLFSVMLLGREIESHQGTKADF
jgi:hypothetical protein